MPTTKETMPKVNMFQNYDRLSSEEEKKKKEEKNATNISYPLPTEILTASDHLTSLLKAMSKRCCFGRS